MNQTQKFRQSAWIGPLCCAITLAGMLALSWHAWADPVVDFGRELYVPWRLAEGEKLYRDVQYFSGPISPYFNSIFIRIFGLKLMTLASVNLILFVGLCAAIYWLGARIADRTSATFATIGVIMTCGLGRLTQIANFNFITPYSHEMTHSLVLSIATILMFERWMRTERRAWLGAIGATIGMIFLMKPEVFLAISGAMLAGLVLSRKFRWKNLAILVGSFVIVPASIALMTLDPVSSLGSIRFLTDTRITSLPFYLKLTGLDKIRANLELAVSRAIYLVGLGLLIWNIARHRKTQLQRPTQILIGTILGAIAFVLPILFFESMNDAVIIVWGFTTTAFTFVMPLAAIVLAIRAWRQPRDPCAALLASLCIFATLLLAKIGLRVSFQIYGFALALPTLFVFGIISIGLIPGWIERSGGSGAIFRIASIAFFSAMILGHLYVTIGWLKPQTATIQTPVARLRYDPRIKVTADTQRVLDMLQRIAEPTDTLAVIPEGAMLNVLSERRNPTGAIVTMPVELFMFGEDDVLARFENDPPNWLVIRVESMQQEYAARGIEYMPKVRAFLAENYEPIEPERPNSFRIYRRR